MTKKSMWSAARFLSCRGAAVGSLLAAFALVSALPAGAATISTGKIRLQLDAGTLAGTGALEPDNVMFSVAGAFVNFGDSASPAFVGPVALTVTIDEDEETLMASGQSIAAGRLGFGPSKSELECETLDDEEVDCASSGVLVGVSGAAVAAIPSGFRYLLNAQFAGVPGDAQGTYVLSAEPDEPPTTTTTSTPTTSTSSTTDAVSTTTATTSPPTTTTTTRPGNGGDPSISATPNPVRVCQFIGGTTELEWTSPGPGPVDIRVLAGTADAGIFESSGPGTRIQTLYGLDEALTFVLVDQATQAELARTTVGITSAGCDQPEGVLEAEETTLRSCSASGTQLSWRTAGVDSVRLRTVADPAGTVLAEGGPAGSAAVTPSSTTTYYLFGLQDSASEALLDSATVTVSDDGCEGPATGSIAASPEEVPVCLPNGGQSDLSWDTNGLDRVEIRVRPGAPGSPDILFRRSSAGPHTNRLYGFDAALTFILGHRSAGGAFIEVDSVALTPTDCEGSEPTEAGVARAGEACEGEGIDRLGCVLLTAAPGAECGVGVRSGKIHRQVRAARRLLMRAAAKPGRAAKLVNQIHNRLARAARIAARAADKNPAAAACAARVQQMSFSAH